MIIEMSKVRIMGPRLRLPEVLGVLQDLGVLHLAPPEAEHLAPLALTAPQERERHHLQDALADVERGLSELGITAGPAPRVGSPTAQDIPRGVEIPAALSDIGQTIVLDLGDIHCRIPGRKRG